MVAQKGSLMLIKVGDGEVSEGFATLGGVQVSSMTLNNALVDSSCLGGGQWRQLLGAAGLLSLRLEGVGIFTDLASEERARGYAFRGDAHNYRLYFGNGDYVKGEFIISMYTRNGRYDAEEGYGLRMESSGEVQFVAG